MSRESFKQVSGLDFIDKKLGDGKICLSFFLRLVAVTHHSLVSKIYINRKKKYVFARKKVFFEFLVDCSRVFFGWLFAVCKGKKSVEVKSFVQIFG